MPDSTPARGEHTSTSVAAKGFPVNMDYKSLAIGLVVGYLVLPRLVAVVASKKKA